jgi:hypothetical protein
MFLFSSAITLLSLVHASSALANSDLNRSAMLHVGYCEPLSSSVAFFENLKKVHQVLNNLQVFHRWYFVEQTQRRKATFHELAILQQTFHNCEQTVPTCWTFFFRIVVY